MKKMRFLFHSDQCILDQMQMLITISYDHNTASQGFKPHRLLSTYLSLSHLNMSEHECAYVCARVCL